MEQSIKGAIKAIIDEADKMSGAYFFIPPQNAGGRRSYEQYYSHDEVRWNEGGHEYTARHEVRCSCKNVYAKGEYTKDGQRTTLTAIKNSYKRMFAEEA